MTPADEVTYQQPVLAVDPGDEERMAIAMLAFEPGNLAACALATSEDGGATWRTRTLIGASGRFPLPRRFDTCRSPTVAYGPDGILVYAFSATMGPVYGQVLVTASPDQGETMSRPVLLDPDVPPLTSECCGGGDWWPTLAVDRSGGDRDGALYAAWVRYDRAFAVGPVLVSRCAPDALVGLAEGGGLRCGEPVEATPPSRASAQKPVLAVGAAGTVWAAWQDISELLPSGYTAPIELAVASSRDGGRSFRGTTTVAADISTGCVFYPQTSCDPVHWDGSSISHAFAAGADPDRLFLAWFRPVGGRNRVLFSSSPDGGRTWALPRTVGARGKSARAHQHRPALAVAPNGRLDVAYYELSTKLRQLVYVASSADDGTTFSYPVPVADDASNARVGPPSDWATPTATFGDRLGLASTGSRTVVAWTDTRRAEAGGRKQDVYLAGATSTARSAPAANAPSSPLPALVALTVALLLAAVGLFVLSLRWPGSRPSAASAGGVVQAPATSGTVRPATAPPTDGGAPPLPGATPGGLGGASGGAPEASGGPGATPGPPVWRPSGRWGSPAAPEEAGDA